MKDQNEESKWEAKIGGQNGGEGRKWGFKQKSLCEIS